MFIFCVCPTLKETQSLCYLITRVSQMSFISVYVLKKMFWALLQKAFFSHACAFLNCNFYLIFFLAGWVIFVAQTARILKDSGSTMNEHTAIVLVEVAQVRMMSIQRFISFNNSFFSVSELKPLQFSIIYLRIPTYIHADTFN